MSFNIIGLGEVLWDLLPSGKKLGGAPANFCYVSACLGNRAKILSRVGRDALGDEILRSLLAKGLTIDAVQTDDDNPTGAVKISLENGQPTYEIAGPVAWDFLRSSDEWKRIVSASDALCFGTLAQRSVVSGETIRELVKLAPNLRVFDVNLRQDFYSAEVVTRSLEIANVIKINHEELPVVAGLCRLKGRDAFETARAILSKFELRLICVTRGGAGSFLVTATGASEHSGFRVEIADTIGAGDAFTAALVDGILNDRRLDEINAFANRIGAFVASNTGAMPEFDGEVLC